MLNTATIQGRLTNNVEVKLTNTNRAVASVCIACDRDFGEGTDFINCVAWEKTADFISKYFKKGAQILCTGRIQVRDYEDKNGHKRTAVELVVDRAHFCEPKQAAEKTSVDITTGDTADDDGLLDISVDDEQIELSQVTESDLPF